MTRRDELTRAVVEAADAWEFHRTSSTLFDLQSALEAYRAYRALPAEAEAKGVEVAVWESKRGLFSFTRIGGLADADDGWPADWRRLGVTRLAIAADVVKGEDRT